MGKERTAQRMKYSSVQILLSLSNQHSIDKCLYMTKPAMAREKDIRGWEDIQFSALT